MEFETRPDGTKFTSTDYSERHAEVFANRYDDGLGNRKVATFRSLAGSLSGIRMLDVGSGEGTFSRLGRANGAQVVAIDFAESMVAATSRRASVPVVRGSADALPCDTDSFDLLVALDVIEHLYQPARALEEFHRVLVPGGRVVLATDRDGLALGLLPFRMPKPVRRLVARGRTEGTASDRARYRTPLCTHVHEFDLDELLTLTDQTGFRLLRLDTYPHQAELDRWGRAIEFVARGPLRRWKWNYVMVMLEAV